MKILIFLAFLSPLLATPVLRPNGIVNAASFEATRGIAQGSLATVFGSGLGPALPGVSASIYPLANTLSGVSIQLTQGLVSIPAIPVFVSEGQVNFLVPSTAPLGQVQLRLTYNNLTSQPLTFQLVRSAPALFTFNDAGRTRAVVQNVVSPASTPLNLANASARPGQTLIAYGTGLGPIAAADNLPAPAGDIPGANVEVRVGGQTARLLYAGRSPCCSGLDQLVFELPANAPLGCAVPLSLNTPGGPSNLGDISIAAAGGTCTNPTPSTTSEFCLEGRYGLLLFTEGFLDWTFAEPGSGTGTLVSTLSFWDSERACLSLPRPTPGTCEFRSDASLSPPPASPAPPPINQVRSRTLDAGPGNNISLRGPARTVTFAGQPFYAGIDALFRSTPFLAPGPFRLNVGGGPDLSGFGLDFNLSPPRLTSPARGASVSGRQPLTVRWTMSPEFARGITTIDLLVGASSITCTVEPQTNGSFTFPASVWNRIPPTLLNSGIGLLQITANTVPDPPRLNSPGLPQGLFLLMAVGHGYDIRFTP